ncbi:unnamed protein product [Parnassius apollo]|uniref:(apollo) hypothetical protein n=1 Tax=Parnassius apollo TaxID=110799 RepID=A0A8S3X900_PARAO|nr:unnamed protein product [Parnassius apollo]
MNSVLDSIQGMTYSELLESLESSSNNDSPEAPMSVTVINRADTSKFPVDPSTGPSVTVLNQSDANYEALVDQLSMPIENMDNDQEYYSKLYKIWCHCDSKSEYLYQFDIYTGKDRSGAPSEEGLGYKVVLKLTKNFWHSAIDRKRNARRIHFKKPGDSEEYPSEVSVIKRRQKKNGKLKDMFCPTAITTYTQYMGRVDKFYHFHSSYPIGRKSRKTWFGLFWFIFESAIFNAYILYCQTRQGDNIHSDFRLCLARALINGYSQRKHKPGNFIKKKGGVFGIPDEIQFSSPGQHHGKKGSYRR